MTESTEIKNKRIAKNTILLYFRTMITVIVSLYTSRIVLQSLGVDDYGVYNVVGGFIGMFAIISGPISNAIARFLTFGLGIGNIDKLKITFSTSVNILLCLSVVIFILTESFGVWFLNYKLNIPSESIYAANWVLQCSILSMILGLLNIPYNSAIIAHEKMGIFAYMSILEVVLKLVIAFSLLFFESNRLILYSIELVVCYFILRIVYWWYCNKNFEECKYKFTIDKSEFKEMTGFAWWSFFGNTAFILNTQGVAVLMNMFFGVLANTAKGIAGQVENAVVSFVNSFSTAFTPQITKSYAEGNLAYMYSIMSRGSRFSIYLFLLFLIPIEFEAPTVLRLWLGEIPPYSVSFLRLTLLCTITFLLGSPYLNGINATGKIKFYQIAVTAVGWTVFPFTWIAYKLNFNVQFFFGIYLVIYFLLIWVRAYFVKKLLGYKISTFFREVFVPTFITGIFSILVLAPLYFVLESNLMRLFIICGANLIILPIIVYFFGMTQSERQFLNRKLHNKFLFINFI